MEIELRSFATYREAIGEKTIERSYDEGTTVGEVLADLESEFDGLEGRLLEDGGIRPQLSILKNGRDVAHAQGVDTPLEPGDTVSLFPPVAGGR
jgi:sulfur-carrier protein